MADKVLFPSAIHAIRFINDNIVNNLLGGRSAYIQLAPIYLHAYALVYETGESPVYENIQAPNETLTTQTGVRIFTQNG